MKIVAFDIESSGLSGDWASILCASFCPIQSDGSIGEVKTLSRTIRPKDPADDKALAKKIKEELDKYNIIVTWNGKMFDIPFLNARLLQAGYDAYSAQMHLDVMYFARQGQLRLASSKLDNVSQFFRTKTRKYDVDHETLQASRAGDKKALQEVIKHCEEDVRILSEVYWKLTPLIRNIHR